jgi:hypothetical protein
MLFSIEMVVFQLKTGSEGTKNVPKRTPIQTQRDLSRGIISFYVRKIDSFVSIEKGYRMVV